MRKILSIITFLLCAAFTLPAQESVKIQAPGLVSVGELFNMTFIFEGESGVSEIEWDPGDGFAVKWGPQKGSSTSVSIINGKRSKSSQTTFTYVVEPKRTGVFQLPAASAKIKNRTVSSGTHTIEVVSGSSSSSSAGSSSGQQQERQDPSSTGTVSSDDIFLRMTLSKSRVVVGEPLTAEIKLFTKVSVAGFEDVRFPSFNGFWSQELKAPQNIEFQREKVGDEIYEAALLRSYTLIPQQSGEISIDPAEMVCQIMVRAPRSSGSIFDSFFQDDYRTIRKRVATPALKVRVSNLPAGAPSSFGGGVGTFRISARLTRDSLKMHDAASLKLTVSGRGNVSMLDAPKVSFPPDFDVYDVKTTENLDKSAGNLSGSKTFEYPFIPRSCGDFTIPPVEYSYYDVSAGRYVTLSTPEMTISVERGSGAVSSSAGAGVPNAGVIQKGVRDLGSDIRFIVSRNPGMKVDRGFFVLSPLFWGLAAALLLVAGLLFLLLRRVAAMKADVAGARGRAATKMARKRLSKAAAYLKENLYSAFYEELHKALIGFASDKFGISFVDMSKDIISERLTGAGVPESMAADFVGLLESCEFARFSSGSGQGSMTADYDKAVEVISGIDSAMKHSNFKKSSAGAAVIALLLAFSPQSFAAPAAAYPDSLWNAGAAAYTAGQWKAAQDNWSDILALGIRTPELYYNLGNACFKSEEYGRAILNYERALKLDPTFQDAKFNLEYAQGFIQDRIEAVPEFFLKTWARSVRHLLSSNAWAVLSLLFLALTLAMVLLYLLSRSTAARKTGFFSAIAAFLLTLVCFLSAVRLRSDASRADRAIVVSAVVSVRSTPGADSSKDLFVLHEGAKVQILDEVGDWKSIEIADGRRGWIRSEAIEII